MNTSAVEQALAALGRRFSFHGEVDLLLVGGAAGMLTGLLPASRTTTDCDVMVYAPESAMDAVERAAAEVAGALGLAANWLNSDVQIRRDVLPEDWRSRRVFVGSWGLLRVFAASRIDLIAMKVLAGRPQDLEDLRSMRPRSDDLEFVRRYLDHLLATGTSAEEVSDARVVLDSLEPSDRA
jgi:hypothetical protein